MQKVAPAISLVAAIGLFGCLALQAEAAAEAPPLAALSDAIRGVLRGAAVVLLSVLAIAAVLLHRPLVSLAHARMVQLSIRTVARHRAPRAPDRPPEPLAPAKHLAEGGDLPEMVKLRMTEVHRQLRRLAPELLPVFAKCRAAQLRLLHDLRSRPGQRHAAETHLIGALVQIEAATRKLSVVLPDTTKEYALGSYADTLEKITGETLDCLFAQRARARGTPRGVQIGGEVDPA